LFPQVSNPGDYFPGTEGRVIAVSGQISQVGNAVSSIIQEVTFGVILSVKIRQKCQNWPELEPVFMISQVSNAVSAIIQEATFGVILDF